MATTRIILFISFFIVTDRLLADEAQSKLKCGLPPEVFNAHAVVSDSQSQFDVEELVNYMCNNGYWQLNGGLPRAKCVRYNGTAKWFGPNFTCVVLTCGNPGTIINGRQHGFVYQYMSSVKYTCNEGYELVGSSIRTCQANRTWNGEKPICIPKQCVKPSSPLHGTVFGVSLNYLSKITYACNVGYRLVGQLSRTCQADGTWSGQDPICEEIRCASLEQLPNGHIEGDKTHVGAMVTFFCDNGAQLVGALSATCQEDGSWSSMPPKCLDPTPPSFVQEPNADKIYYVVLQTPSYDTNSHYDSKLKEGLFSCRATGVPSVTYKWLKNGNEFSLDDSAVLNRISRVSGEGSFKLTNLTADDEGKYECIAENGSGTAVNKAVYFIRAFIETFKNAREERLNANFGDPFEKECKAPHSVPPARVYWILTTGGSNLEQRQFMTINDTNIAVNDNGTIYFQYVRNEDNRNKFFYTCIAENMETKDVIFGRQFDFNVVRPPGWRTSLEPYIVPQKQYVSPDTITVLRGSSLELFCIYAGYPDIIPTWSKIYGGIDYSRVSWGTNFKKSIKIDNIQTLDEGLYVCEERNRIIKHTFNVTVESVPYFAAEGKPGNVNSTEGRDVEFVWNVQSRPLPAISLYKNGNPIQHGGKYKITASKFVIRDIKKGENGIGDNAVYQLKASNVHGSLWTNFYLNIIGV